MWQNGNHFVEKILANAPAMEKIMFQIKCSIPMIQTNIHFNITKILSYRLQKST